MSDDTGQGNPRLGTPVAPLGQTGMLERFVQPESVLTPGTGGLVVMMMAVGIEKIFGHWNYLHLLLGLSFFVGVVVLAKSGPWFLKMVYYVINSFIIFFMALGAYASLSDKTLTPDTRALPSPVQSVTPGVTVTTRDYPAGPPAPQR